jgi:hypothetical protein
MSDRAMPLPDERALARNWNRIAAKRLHVSTEASLIPKIELEPARVVRALLEQTRQQLVARFPEGKPRAMLERFLADVEDAACAELHITRAQLLGHSPSEEAVREGADTNVLEALQTFEDVFEAMTVADELGR